jgi:hypothetical protein
MQNIVLIDDDEHTRSYNLFKCVIITITCLISVSFTTFVVFYLFSYKH